MTLEQQLACRTHVLWRRVVVYIRLDEQMCFANPPLRYLFGGYGITHNQGAPLHVLFVELESFPNKRKFAADIFTIKRRERVQLGKVGKINRDGI